MKIILITFCLIQITLANFVSAEPLELVLAEAFEGACGPDKVKEHKHEEKKPSKHPKHPKHPKQPKNPKLPKNKPKSEKDPKKTKTPKVEPSPNAPTTKS